MKLDMIVVLAHLAQIVQSWQFTLSDDSFKVVSKFIGNLVRDGIESEKSDFFDTLLLRMEIKSETNLFGEIALQVSPAALMTMDCSYLRKEKIQQRFSMIIVTVDDNDGVNFSITLTSV